MRFVLLIVLTLALGGCGPAPAAKPAEPAPSEILWDTWGVPHIFAADAPGMFHAFGWAQMAAHGDLLLELYGQARGRAAEYWGAGHLQGDQYVRAMGAPARARDWYAAQSDPMRAGLDAFAAGINAFARAYPERLDADRRQVLPVEAVSAES